MTRVLTVEPGGTDIGRTALIWGSGAGGTAAAIDLASQGWRVFLSDPYVEFVPQPGLLNYSGVAGDGAVVLRDAGLTLGDAVEQASIILVATLATAGTDAIRPVVGALGGDQVVVGGCGGLISLRLVSQANAGGSLGALELACFPYSSRFRPDGSLRIRRRRPVRFAAVDPARTLELAEALPEAWRGEPAVNVLHAAVLNPNYVVHPASVVVNVAARDRCEAVPHEGLTDGARRIAAELDREKGAILRALGLPDISLTQLMGEMESKGVKASNDEDPPEEMLDRYVLEDCGLGLSLLAGIAGLVGVKTPTIDSIRFILAASLEEPPPEFPFESIGLTPEGLVETWRVM